MTRFWIFDSKFWIGSSERNKAIFFSVYFLLFALCSSAGAQQAKKVYRLGYLGGALGIDEREETFRQGLKELGYIEGQNIVLEWRFAKGYQSRLPELATELVRLKPDILATTGTQPAHALKNATTTIPIVVLSAGDLVGREIVASLARPGGNITGFTRSVSE